MAQGSRTPAELEAKFRGEYLRLGNASEAARILGIPDRTGRELGQRADKDAEFAEARRALYAGALDEIEALMMGVVRTAYQRHQDDIEQPEVPDGFRGTVVVKDERPAYGRLVVDAHRASLSRKKFLVEKEGSGLGAVKLEIELTDGRASASEDGEPEVPPESAAKQKPTDTR